MVRFNGLRHVHLKVRDVERSVRFYEEAFGMVRVMDKHDSQLVVLATPECGDVLTVSSATLTPDVDAGIADPAVDRAGDNGGVDHLGFALADHADFDAAVDQICGAGGSLLVRDELGAGWPTAFLRDPDGYVLQI